jgi:hypothetical protein
MSNVDNLLNDQELAEKLRVSQQVVGNMRRAKKIPCVTLSRSTIRFCWEDVLAALKANSEEEIDE